MENNKTPEIRFTEFSDEWKEQKLCDVADFFDEQRIPVDSEQRKAGEYPYYGATGIIDYVDSYIFDGEYVLLAEDGANIIMRRSPIAYLTKGKFWLNNHAHIMRMKNGANNFLIQLLEIQNYQKYNSGTAQPKLNAQVVKGIIFKFPSLKEQTKIGNFFKKFDDIIFLHQRELGNLKQMKQGFLQKMFPKEGETVPELRFPEFEDEWKYSKLGECAEFNPKVDIPEKFEYVDLESVEDTILKTHRTELKATAPSRAQRLANQGDIFYQMVRPYQKNNYFYNLPFYNYVFSTGYAQIRPYADSYFLFAKIQEEKFVLNVLDRCTGTSYPAINSKELAKINVQIPSYQEQKQIGAFFKQLDTLINLHQQELDLLKQTKKAFLQKMFI